MNELWRWSHRDISANRSASRPLEIAAGRFDQIKRPAAKKAGFRALWEHERRCFCKLLAWYDSRGKGVQPGWFFKL
jgi:hypothetical protein